MAGNAESDDFYRAVGRYVVEFSRLVFHMRYGVERRLTAGGDPTVASLALGEVFANQITETFFATCEHVADLNDAERRVGVRLRKEVRDEISRRNDFAHGDWSVGAAAFKEEPTLSRVKPGRKDGSRQQKQLPPADIDAISDSLFALRQKVAEYGAACLGTYFIDLRNGDPVQVRHVLKMDGNQVIRTKLVEVEWV
jgi:hypothetical protein